MESCRKYEDSFGFAKNKWNIFESRGCLFERTNLNKELQTNQPVYDLINSVQDILCIQYTYLQALKQRQIFTFHFSISKW